MISKIQENGLNVIHIESRKSKRAGSEYEIFVNLESQTDDRVPVPKVVKSLKRQLSNVQVVGDMSAEQKSLSFEKNEDINESVDTIKQNGIQKLTTPSAKTSTKLK